MTVGQRIKFLIESKNLTVQDFGSLIGKSKATIYNYIESKSMPQMDVAESILSSFPKLNARWLLTGEGDTWLNEEMITQNSTGHGSNNVAHLTTTVSEARLRALTAELEAAQAMAAQLQKQIEILTRYLGDKDELLDMLRAEVERLKRE